MPLTPIIPFEPTSTDIIPDEDNWVAQVKWDGVRVLTYWDGNQVKLYNRKKNERTFHYPELLPIQTYCKAKSVILDGEIISLGSDGKPSFHEVMRRDGIRRLERVKQVRKDVPICYMIFDVIYCDGQWLTERSLLERSEILSRIIVPGEHVQLVTSHEDAEALFQVIKEHEMEGIVIKDLSSTYLINGKDPRWRKKKFYRDLIAVVGGVTLRDTIVNSLLLGLFDRDGRLWYIGHAGTGRLTRKDWLELTRGIKPLIISTMPFANKPSRWKETIWLKPEITVKVNFAEWSVGHTLRQPSIQAFVDVPPHECLLP
ncbi:RNA ligase family protein [Thermoactinomyces sp. CICC 10521]|jgi:bifunctional non-homologous end joining protein LigD|uniref:ATP-dependent DNA ligase n=1 Tax=Thermoactinomyces sp. CICC 10521 TaxID=2767426 RepID=UPI0018DCE4A3|nr:RNA ligase family protein [Thermoactinomyces sp. CICC 10521]MBH8607923.1 DNA ligase [Thermoactinomyces sp. CICC 10521]